MSTAGAARALSRGQDAIEQVFGHGHGGGGVVVHARAHCNRGGGRTRNRPKGPIVLSVIFSYTQQYVIRVILPLPKRVSFTALPRARAAFCFLALLIHIIAIIPIYIL